MEDHGGHPLLHGGHHLQTATALAYAWDPPLAPFDQSAGGDQLECFSTTSELRQALLRALAELDASRAAHQAELRRMESEAARLAALVASAAAERDELRRHCHSLLLLLHHQSQTPPPQSLPAAHVPTTHAAAVLGGGPCATGAVEEHAADAAASSEEAEMEMALTRRLPDKGRLVEAVVSAGPLLQTLLLAGPLPRWRHPPPPAPAGGADIPPFNPGRPSPTKADPEACNNNSFSSASAASSSPESNCSGGGGPAPVVAQQALPYHMSSFCM